MMNHDFFFFNLHAVPCVDKWIKNRILEVLFIEMLKYNLKTFLSHDTYIDRQHHIKHKYLL